MARKAKLQQLDNNSTGDCPVCGEAPAFPFGLPGLNGYVDACPECAEHCNDDLVDDLRADAEAL
jgi:hypothetical protein